MKNITFLNINSFIDQANVSNSFKIAVKKDLYNLGQLIADYNKASSLPQKKERLLDIYHHQQYIAHQYRRDYLGAIPQLHSFLFNHLFQEIHEAFAELGYLAFYNADREQIERDSSDIPEHEQVQVKNYFDSHVKHFIPHNGDENNIQTLQELRQKYRQKMFETNPEHYSYLRRSIASINLRLRELQPTPDSVDTAAFSKLLATMSNRHVNKLAQGLFNATVHDKNIRENVIQHAFATLYADNEPTPPAYHQFLDEHSVRFLGGNNSKNFLITHIITGETHVLKLESYAFVNALSIVDKLATMSPVNNTLLKTFAERPVLISQHATRLVLTESCEGGDLENMATVNVEDKYQTAINLYEQMATILHSFEQHDVLFLDMKNSNWLINSQNQLRLADTKSFLPTNSNICDTSPAKEISFPDSVHSYFMTDRLNYPLKAWQLHGYMLSKNIYQFLTGCDCNYLYHVKENYYSDSFNHPIFTGMVGEKFKSLIIGLLRNTTSVEQALIELKKIQVFYLVEKIAHYAQQNQDSLLWNSLDDIIHDTQNTNHLEDLDEHNQWLKQIVTTISSPQMQECNQLLRDINNSNLGQHGLIVAYMKAMIDRRNNVSNNSITNKSDYLQSLNDQLLAMLNTINSKDVQDCYQLITQINAAALNGNNSEFPALTTYIHHDYLHRVTTQLTQAIQEPDKLPALKENLTNTLTAMISQEMHACYQLLEQIKHCKVGDNDHLLSNYVNTINHQLHNAIHDKKLLADLEQELTTTLASVNSREVKQLNIIIQEFRDKAKEFFSIMPAEKKAKASLIEQALQNTPVSERGHAFDNFELKKVLAHRRHFKKDTTKKESGESVIIEKNAAQSYHNMKKFVANIREQQQPTDLLNSPEPDSRAQLK